MKTYATNPDWWDGWTEALRDTADAIPDGLRELPSPPTSNVRDEVAAIYAEAERKALAIAETCRAAQQVLERDEIPDRADPFADGRGGMDR